MSNAKPEKKYAHLSFRDVGSSLNDFQEEIALFHNSHFALTNSRF